MKRVRVRALLLAVALLVAAAPGRAVQAQGGGLPPSAAQAAERLRAGVETARLPLHTRASSLWF